MKPKSGITFAVIIVCFLLSGAAGLIYQVVWSRYLAVFLGHTSYAVVAVLVAFMGGLALGNVWFGARADRSNRPLGLYAGLEIGIGVYAILFPIYFTMCHDGFVTLARAARPGSTALFALKFFFSLATILLPTVLMGATLPVLTRYITRSLAELRERVAALYAINSAGAVAGCLVADFWWIPNSGLEMTVYRAAALNLIVGVVALALSLRTEGGAAENPTPPDIAGLEEPRYSEGASRLALIGIGISGGVAMLYEVAWTRLLALAVGSSTHAFSLMLVTFITGIALGAGIIYLWKGLRKTLMAFGWAELALAGTLFASLFFYQYLSFWFVKLASLLSRREGAYPLYGFIQAAICFAVMLVPTVCLGMTLPLVSRIATVELTRTGRSVGRVFAINTIGTVFGTVITGLWLLPRLGLARTFAVGIALNLLIGLAAVTWTKLADKRRALIVPSVIAISLVWMASAHLERTWQRAFSLGLWRAANPPRTLAEFRETVAAMPLSYHKDGASATVDVYSWKDEGREHLTLKVNGKADASTQSDMITQLLLGHLPMLLRPDSKDALVIGLGSGMTCGAVARHPPIDRIDAVEISPEVIEGARLFASFNDRVLDNPKLHLAIEDAKSFLKITDRQYDLIISEPSNPWMAGVAGVFSREYYESCAKRLKPGGLVAQWMHVYETSDETVNMVLRTFLSVFPYMSVWQPALGDLILVGSTQPSRPDLEAMQRRFSETAVRSDLARVGLLTLPPLLAREIVPPQNGLFMVSGEGVIHSDFFPELEYLAQKGFFLNRIAEQWRQFREDFSPRARTLLGQYLRNRSLTEEDFGAFVRDFQEHRMPEPRLFRSLLLRWQGESNRVVFPAELWTTAWDRATAAELRTLRFAPFQESMLSEASTNPGPARLHMADRMEAYRSQRSIFHLPPTQPLEQTLEKLIAADPAQQRIYKLHLAEIAWDRGDDGRCLQLGESAFNPDTTKNGPIDFTRDLQAPRAVLYRMTETLWRAGRVREAWELCQQAKAGGYLANAAAIFPLLEVSFRRIEAALANAPAAGAP